MMTFLFKWWRKSQRSTDIRLFWPVCKEQAPDLETARTLFYVHAMMDTAWTKDYTEHEITRFVDALS